MQQHFSIYLFAFFDIYKLTKELQYSAEKDYTGKGKFDNRQTQINYVTEIYYLFANNKNSFGFENLVAQFICFCSNLKFFLS